MRTKNAAWHLSRRKLWRRPRPALNWAAWVQGMKFVEWFSPFRHLLVQCILPLKGPVIQRFRRFKAEYTTRRYLVLFGDNCINFAVVILADDALPKHIPGKAHGGLVGSQPLVQLIHRRSPPFSEPQHSRYGSSNAGLLHRFETSAHSKRR